MVQSNSSFPTAKQQPNPAVNKPVVEQKIQFQIPQAPLQMPSVPPEQLAKAEPESEPKKKKSWKMWVIIISVIIIIVGLGYYFLKG
jgi:hypothetical protein